MGAPPSVPLSVAMAKTCPTSRAAIVRLACTADRPPVDVPAKVLRGIICADGPLRSITEIGFSSDWGALPENPVTIASPGATIGNCCAYALPVANAATKATLQMSFNLRLLILLSFLKGAEGFLQCSKGS